MPRRLSARPTNRFQDLFDHTPLTFKKQDSKVNAVIRFLFILLLELLLLYLISKKFSDSSKDKSSFDVFLFINSLIQNDIKLRKSSGKIGKLWTFFLHFFQKTVRFLVSKLLISLKPPSLAMVTDPKLLTIFTIHTIWYFCYDHHFEDETHKQFKKSKLRKYLQEVFKAIRKGIS